jgi:hypothetical protein
LLIPEATSILACRLRSGQHATDEEAHLQSLHPRVIRDKVAPLAPRDGELPLDLLNALAGPTCRSPSPCYLGQHLTALFGLTESLSPDEAIDFRRV